MLDAIEAWRNKERLAAEVPMAPGPSRCWKALSVEDLFESILVSFALEDEAILLKKNGACLEVYGLACP